MYAYFMFDFLKLKSYNFTSLEIQILYETLCFLF